MLRGTIEAFRAIATVAAWEAGPRAASRRRAPPARLAATSPPTGRRGATSRVAGRRPRRATRRALSERESLALLGGAGRPRHGRRGAASDADAAVAAAAAARWPGRPQDRRRGPRPQVGCRRRPARPRRTRPRSVGPPRTCSRSARASRGTARTSRGLLVEPMADAGLELIVGLTRDPQFGPVVLVGLGGILAEALDDVTLALAPRRPR